MRPILIWDLPTRLFHWCLAASFAGAWLSTDSDRWLSVHVFLGYLMLALVGFRFVWGWVGTRYARFSSFSYGPREGLRYLKAVAAGNAPRHVGHNPSGSLAIYLLLALVLVVGATGYLLMGGEEQQGAAAAWLSIPQGRLLKKLHEASALLMLMLVAAHLAGVVVESLLHHENLARSMLTGIKAADGTHPAVASRWPVALLMAAAMGGFALWWFAYDLHPLQGGAARVKFVGPQLADNAQWRDECGSCHLAFHPTLLPRRSWRKLMATQAEHFGSDLALDDATSASLLSFLLSQPAESHVSEPAYKIDLSLPASEVPLRITETPYWIKKHRELSAADWNLPSVKSKANCGACHSDADAGTFEDAAMKLPRG